MKLFRKIYFLRKPFKSNENLSINKISQQYSLIPLTIDKELENKDGEFEKNPAYQPILDIAQKISEKGINNIALTGPYGSGKSSIIKTLQKDYSQYDYLPISLATLECLDDSTAKDDKNQTNNIQNENIKKIKSDESINRKIEYSILQQLIYKEKINDIPQSRFKRIRHISNKKSYLYGIGIVLLVIACFVLFEPKFLRIQSLHNFFSCSPKWKIFWDLLFTSYVIIFFVIGIKKIILNTYNNQINKLNFKNGEIEIKESTSIFNKHLDEIIYFFEVTKYNVVLIEDLDRFDTHNIFLKLRELNFLLNNSKAIRRDFGKIVFIYAIRDDIFKDTSRVKFFDYISTVIPVINPSNSKDKLQNALRDKGIKEISDDVCMELGIYIDDMRILKNIVNEYVQYSNKLKNLSPRKMLGMILYKNYHPDDFASLHNQKGVVYDIISQRVKYHNSNAKEKEAEINKLKEEKDKIINYHNNTTAKEIRSVYVMKYVVKIGLIQFFKENQNNQGRYTIQQVIDDEEVFEKLENNLFKYYENPSYGNQQLQFNFKDIEKEVNPNMSYRNRLIALPKRIDQINTRLDELNEEIIELRTLPLNKILQSYSAEDFFKDVKEDRLIAFLIKAGYIDENYYDFISYFYPGVLAPSDKEFILDLKIGRKKEFDYKIYKTKAVINEIHESLFSRIEILNVDILDFLVKNKKQFSPKYTIIRSCIIRNLPFDFLKIYYMHGKENKAFFIDVFSIWDSFFTTGILNESNTETRYSNFEILLKFFPLSKISNFDTPEFKNFVADNFEFIANKINVIGITNIESIFKSLEIKFNLINEKIETSNEFINLIINGFYFKLSSDNIKNILKTIYPNNFQDFSYSSYSAILDTTNSKLIEYINKNIEYCIDNVFSDTSTQENSMTIISILNNKELSDNTKNKYLSKQENKINTLNEIDITFWDNALISNIIEPSWDNVEKYISNDKDNDINETIINFIATNSRVLSEHKVSGILSEENDSKLFKKIFGSNDFPLEPFEQIIKSFNRFWTSLDISSFENERVEILVRNNKLEFNENFYKKINDDFNNLLLTFVVKNKSKFLSNINKYPLTSKFAIEILKSSSFTGDNKVQILKSIQGSLFVIDNELSNTTGAFIISCSSIIVSKEILLSIIKGCTKKELKLKLLIKGCYELSYDKIFVKSGLESLGGDFAMISKQSGHRRKFKATEDNKKLIEFLDRHSFISKYFEKDDGVIQVNAKNIK